MSRILFSYSCDSAFSLLKCLIAAQHQTNLLDATLDEFFEQDENHGAHHTIRTRYGEEIFLKTSGGWIETGAKACHGNDGLANGMNGVDGETIGSHALAVEIVDELLLALRIFGQELHRAVAVRTYTLATKGQRFDVLVVEHSTQSGGRELRWPYT